jgi:hypothetical protein
MKDKQTCTKVNSDDFDFQEGCRWEVSYFGKDSFVGNIDDDFRLVFTNPNGAGEEVTIDVIPPKALYSLYDAIWKALQERHDFQDGMGDDNEDDDD